MVIHPTTTTTNIHSIPQATAGTHTPTITYTRIRIHMHMPITATRKIESDERANVVFPGSQEPAPCVDRRPCCCYCNLSCTLASRASFVRCSNPPQYVPAAALKLRLHTLPPMRIDAWQDESRERPAAQVRSYHIA
ncbi:hypothetical protein FDECE_13147 [Fusarium decemcellulare]|nr:hypothetical protein FDECE_13147 [Fusarium decemcellulare]